MSDIDTDQSNAFLYCTIIGFAVISWLVWNFLLAPSPRAGASTTSSASSGTQSSTTRSSGGAVASSSTPSGRSAAATASTRTSRTATSASASSKNDDDDDDGMFTFGRPRHPPHLIASEQQQLAGTDLSNLLLQGIVPFRSTPASGYETRLKNKNDDSSNAPADPVVVNRRERARIFARMFRAAAGSRPPNRGANVVVTVRHDEVSCAKLQKALFLLGTYYNLFLLIDGSGASLCADGSSGAGIGGGSDGEKERREFIKKMRLEILNQGTAEEDASSKEYKLNADVVPPHRIGVASTSKGRVAFVRQLHGTELVVDFDENVTKELERFGFRVLVYPQAKEGGEGISALGSFLIP